MKRPGGRTKRTSEAVFDAALTILAGDGYSGLTVEALADYSGVHKTTIYRRWGSADSVFAEVVTAIAEREVPVSVSDDSMKDLNDLARSVVANLEGPVGRAVAAASLGRPDDDNFVLLVHRFWEKRISEASVIVIKGKEGGRVDRTLDPSAVIEEIVAQLWFRVMVLRADVTDDDISGIVNRAVTPT